MNDITRSSTAPRLRYRSALEVRSIPNGLWDKWLANDAVPWATFAATPDVQRTLRHVSRSAVRRAGR